MKSRQQREKKKQKLFSTALTSLGKSKEDEKIMPAEEYDEQQNVQF